MSTKIHACIDALGNAVRLVATVGQAGDCLRARGLREGLDTRMVIADTSYDSDANRAYWGSSSKRADLHAKHIVAYGTVYNYAQKLKYA